MGCNVLRCPSCLPRLAWRRGLAIAHAQPERFVTLTRVGNDWPTVRGRMKRLRHALAAEVGSWEWVWSVEANPKGTGHHVHCHQRGRFVKQGTLSRLAAVEGMGRVADIRRWHDAKGAATSYGMKAVTYTFKDATGSVDAAGFLATNGRRLTHQSRGWWTAGGARDQEAAAIRDYFGDDDGEWVVVMRGHETRWMRAQAMAGRNVGSQVG